MITIKELNETIKLSKNENGLINMKIGTTNAIVRNWDEVKECFELPCFVDKFMVPPEMKAECAFEVCLGGKSKRLGKYHSDILTTPKQEIYDILYKIISTYWDLKQTIDKEMSEFNSIDIKIKE